MSIMQERVKSILKAPLDVLVFGKERVCPQDEMVRDWDLPEKDLSALVSWGLPVDVERQPNIQREPGPVLTPNVASEREERLIGRDERLYRLISQGGEDVHWIGAVAGSGRVLAISPEPMTVNDIHPQLRAHRPDFYKPSVAFVNSSIAQFVEISWRWWTVEQLFYALRSPNPMNFTDRAKAKDAFLAHIDLIERCERLVLEHIELIDDKAFPDGRNSFWWEIVAEYMQGRKLVDPSILVVRVRAQPVCLRPGSRLPARESLHQRPHRPPSL